VNMNSPSGVQPAVKAFKTRSTCNCSVQYARVALLRVNKRHVKSAEMRDRVVCVGPHLRCAPHKGAVFALRTQGPTLPCGATANSQVERHE
jgi:hypothetical protein